MEEGKKRVRLAAWEKLKWINKYLRVKETVSQRSFCEANSISRAALSDWINKRGKLIKEDSGSKKFKPNPYTLYKDIELKALKWFNSRRERGTQVKKYCIRLKAMKVAHKLNYKDFKASDSWFKGFKLKNKISLRKINDHQNKGIAEVYVLCKSYLTELNSRISVYEKKQILNFDETRFE